MSVHIRLCAVMPPLTAMVTVQVAVMLQRVHVERVMVPSEVQPTEPLQHPRLSQHSPIHLPLLDKLLRLNEVGQFGVREVTRDQHEGWGEDLQGHLTEPPQVSRPGAAWVCGNAEVQVRQLDEPEDAVQLATGIRWGGRSGGRFGRDGRVNVTVIDTDSNPRRNESRNAVQKDSTKYSHFTQRADSGIPRLSITVRIPPCALWCCYRAVSAV